MSRNALISALVAAALAALAVAGQRVGLALTLALLAVIATAVASAVAVPTAPASAHATPSGAASSGATRAGRRAGRRVDRPALALAVGLALQPTLRDAGWVVAPCTVAALVAGAAAVASPGRWTALRPVVVAPVRLLGGTATVGRAVRARAPAAEDRRWIPVARGVGLAAVLVAGFGALFASADPAFADASGDLLDVGADPAGLAWRATLALLACGTAGALARLGEAGTAVGPTPRPVLSFGRTELVIALGALVALFAAFVLVQRPVLFGGEGRVLRTTDLGYGEDARAAFAQLLVVAALTLGVVGVAARSRDRLVRGLLGALCVLTLVVLLSAHLRIGLVSDAYGLTRVRYGGQAMVVWLALVLGIVLAAGALRSVADRAPRIVLLCTLAVVLGFALMNPDGRIGASVVARAAADRPIDRDYVRGLSADALPQLRRIPRTDGGTGLRRPIERRLERPDGVFGLNVGRWTAR